MQVERAVAADRAGPAAELAFGSFARQSLMNTPSTSPELLRRALTAPTRGVAVLLAVTDDDELERLVLAHSPKFQALLDKSRHQIEETGGIPHEQFWREVEAETRKPADKTGPGSRRTRR